MNTSVNEDGIGGVPANATGPGISGSSGDTDPSKPLAQFLFKKKLTRPMPDRQSSKPLRDILVKKSKTKITG